MATLTTSTPIQNLRRPRNVLAGSVFNDRSVVDPGDTGLLVQTTGLSSSRAKSVGCLILILNRSSFFSAFHQHIRFSILRFDELLRL